MDAYIRSEAAKLQRAAAELKASRQRPRNFSKSYSNQVRDYNSNSDSYNSQVNARRSRRSPDEGLFFDDSVKKRQP